MNYREKLLNILMDELPDPSPWDGEIRLLLERLLANGVTIQRWIPVDERLPKPFVSVLVHMPIEEPMPTVREGFLSQAGEWYCGQYRRDTGIVTHWMPMPEPPIEEQNRAKGENDA